MSEDKILNKYIELINKGYCCDCNELNCIDNFPQKKITNAISNLQQENQQLKEVIDKANNHLITLIQIIMEQPSKDAVDDLWLLNRLESISTILNKGVKDE